LQRSVVRRLDTSVAAPRVVLGGAERTSSEQVMRMLHTAACVVRGALCAHRVLPVWRTALGPRSQGAARRTGPWRFVHRLVSMRAHSVRRCMRAHAQVVTSMPGASGNAHVDATASRKARALARERLCAPSD
jgi:hypothetical protein